MILGKKIKLFPLALIASAVLFYLYVIGHTGLLFGLLLGFLVVERLSAQLGLYIGGKMILSMRDRLLHEIALRVALEKQAQRSSQGPGLRGGIIEPPKPDA